MIMEMRVYRCLPGRLPALDRARCIDYLERYGTPAAKAWAAARRA